MMKFGAVICTDGLGYWSTFVVPVKCTCADVPYTNPERSFGELRIYFDTVSWDVYEKGLIYTDNKFLSGVRQVFEAAGFDASDIGYSEQGMQGVDYVSMDAGEKFLASWKKIVG